MTELRIRAAAVVLRGDRVLVVLRERDGQRYAVLPGGGVERDETPQHAGVRELREETGLVGTVEALLPVGLDRDAPALYFRVRVADPEPSPALSADAPEVDRADESNRYRPTWVGVDQLTAVGLVPERAVTAVQAAVRSSGQGA